MTEREHFEAWAKQHPQEIEVKCPVCSHTFYEWPNDKQHTEAITEWNRRAQPAQAGQVLTDEKLWEMWVESPSDVLRFARAIEQAALAKRVPMFMSDGSEFLPPPGIVGEKGGA